MFRQDDERERFYNDAVYEAWRSGVNPDRIDRDRTDEAFYRDRNPEDVVRDLQRFDRSRREQREQEEYENQRREEYERECDESEQA